MDAAPALGAKPVFSWRSFLSRLVLAMSDLYAVAIIGILLAWLVTGYTFWPIMLAAYVSHWLLLSGVILFTFMIWRRRWKRAALSGVIVAAFLILFGELYLPSFSTPSGCTISDTDCPPHLVVMTFNSNFGNANDDLFIAALRDSQADIIGLQEFSLADAKLVKDQLSDLYPYQIQQGDGIPGIGLISRYPIIRYEFIMPPSQRFPFVDSDVDVNGETIRVIVAHPPPPARVEGSGEIVSRTMFDTPLMIDLMTDGGPTFMLADLNIPDQSREYNMLRQAGLLDVWREEGWGFGLTFPAAQFGVLPAFPLWRIDYIWHTADFKVQSVRVGPATGSDHLPVLAELVIED